VKTLISGILLCALGAAVSAHAQEKDPLFQDHSVFRVVLTAPLSQVYAQRTQDVRIYFPGQWSYTNEDGTTQRLDVGIRTRGVFRREYCKTPPLQLNFKKAQVKETLFAGQNKLKMVVPCLQGPEATQNVILEYLAYRTFQILTDKSFGTRLIRLSYLDSDEKLRPWTDLVFVIEDDGDLAKRLNLKKIKVASNHFHQLDSATTALAELFQFLIANNDYSVLAAREGDSCCHNTEILALQDDADVRFPVPYDFDFSGLVNAPYAVPPERLPIRSVRSRYYRGLCQSREELDHAIAEMQSKRDEITALFENTTELSANRRRRSLKFIDDFFEILSSPERIEEEIIGLCRGRERLEEAPAKD
jgi:hypothetical protein